MGSTPEFFLLAVVFAAVARLAAASGFISGDSPLNFQFFWAKCELDFSSLCIYIYIYFWHFGSDDVFLSHGSGVRSLLQAKSSKIFSFCWIFLFP